MDFNKKAIEMIFERNNFESLVGEALNVAECETEFSEVINTFLMVFDYAAACLLATNLFGIDLEAYFAAQGIDEIDTATLQKLVATLYKGKEVLAE